MTEVLQKVREAYPDVPSSWGLERLKFYADVRNSNIDKTLSVDEEPVWLCNYTDVYYNDRITPDMDFMEGTATEAEIERFQLRRGQVLITKDSEAWDDIGIPALVTEDMPRVLCGYHLSVLDPGPALDGRFLAWLCRAEPVNCQFKLATNGVTRFGLAQYPMKNVVIAVPPLGTQQRIAQFLDEKTGWIDGVVARIAGRGLGLRGRDEFLNSSDRSLLGLLVEYRASLIAAAVTGRMEALNDH